jgi:ubiquinone/menaquinone biosynthesis C-methylase UbiE
MDLHSAITLIRSPLIDATGPARWADVGAGSGLFTNALARLLYPDSEIYAVDKKSMREFPDLPKTVHLHRLQLDFTLNDLPFSNLDGILMANFLHFVKDRTAFVQKLKTVLKTEGMLIVVEYDTDIPVSGWVPYPLGFLTLKELFNSAGFGKVERLGEYPSVYGRTMYSAAIRA